METKKRALGIGLEQLFNNENLDLQSFEQHVYETTKKEENAVAKPAAAFFTIEEKK